MKRFLAKFKISNALDSGKPLPPSLQEQIARSPDLRDFVQSASRLGRALEMARPRLDAAPSLHASIMRAVGAAARAQPPELKSIAWTSSMALAGTLAVLLAGFWLIHPAAPRAAATLQPMTEAWDAGGQMAQNAPSLMLEPLSDEWQRLNQDANRTARCLLSSLP
ncbi:MAG TPA: hypothetical protein VG146_22095 [Verrucomicrobiae bacterium]|nr:hypothetical protein [Verrucomicrobiae bacterium]